MSNACTITPKVGANLMKGLRQQFKYETAAKIFLQATNPDFIRDYSHTLKLDEENIPTLESVLDNVYIKTLISKNDVLDKLQEPFKETENTQQNYSSLVRDAYTFNTQNANKTKYVAIVEQNDNGTIQVKIKDLDNETISQANNQYASQQLNEKIANIFKPVGITIGHLTDVETKAGRVGVIDFSKVKGIAVDFANIIRVANNKEGAESVSEEFSHLMIGVFKDERFVQRSLDYLKNNEDALKLILGKDYEDVYNFSNGNLDLVAEEALGHILQQTLLNQVAGENLFERTVLSIQDKFKNYNEEAVYKAIQDVVSDMNQFAKEIINGKRNLTKEKIETAQRNVQLNALSKQLQRNIDILKHAQEIEAKRLKIVQNQNIRDIAGRQQKRLTSAIDSENDTQVAEAIFAYGQEAIDALKMVNNQLNDDHIKTMDTKELAQLLRLARTSIASYTQFIKEARIALEADKRSSAEERVDTLTKEFEKKDHSTATIEQMLKDLTDIIKSINAAYVNYAQPAFAKFIETFLNDKVKKAYLSAKGKELTIEELLAETDHDISFFDCWIDSMAESSDLLLQLFDKAVKEQKDKARERTINFLRESTALRQKAERLGITDFEFMFEKDEGNKTGHYISEVNYGKAERLMKEKRKELDEKYGKNVIGEKAKQKLEELNLYRSKLYTPVKIGTRIVGYTPTIKNAEYDSLSSDQKEILKEYRKLLDTLKRELPYSKVPHETEAIAIRKDKMRRLTQKIGSDSNIFKELGNALADDFCDNISNDTLGMYKKGLIDFEGHEYMTIPILYNKKLENPNELTTDVFSAINQYAYMAYNYNAMDKVVDILEVGRTLVIEERQTNENFGDSPLMEQLSNKITKKINKTDTNINKKLNEFFNSQIYGRYLKDAGSLKISDTKSINYNKLVSKLLGLTATFHLGFNFLANIASMTNGYCMQHVEAAAGEYFKRKDLFKADGEYFSMIGAYLAEYNSRFKQSKLALFDEFVDFKGEFKKQLEESQSSNALERVFGKFTFFIGQLIGDHWLYNRTAIASYKNKKVLLNGKEISLWDALEIVEDKNGLKTMKLKDGVTELDGSKFSVRNFNKQIMEINHQLFGIYNDADRVAAKTTILGRILLQYKDFWKPQFNKRFQAKQMNNTLGVEQEGYYRTVGRIVYELIRGKRNFANLKSSLTEDEVRNIKRALSELGMFLCLALIIKWAPWGDDRHRPFAAKLAEYSARRLQHEMGMFVPSNIMLNENLKTVKNPFPVTGTIESIINLAESLINPEDYMEEIQSGPYEGMTELEKNIYLAPIPGVMQYRQIRKLTNDIDNSINYYSRQ